MKDAPSILVAESKYRVIVNPVREINVLSPCDDHAREVSVVDSEPKLEWPWDRCQPARGHKLGSCD